MLGLHVFGVRFFIEHTFLFPRSGIVAGQFRMVLVAVQFNHVNLAAVRTPRDVGEITVGGVAGLQPNGLFRNRVEHANGHLVRLFSGHGILAGIGGGNPRGDVHLRIVGHHALVHTVKGQQLSVRAPKRAFDDAKLVAVYGLAIHEVVASVLGHGDGFSVFTFDDIQILFPHESQVVRGRCAIQGSRVGGIGLCIDFFPFFEINDGVCPCVG